MNLQKCREVVDAAKQTLDVAERNTAKVTGEYNVQNNIRNIRKNRADKASEKFILAEELLLSLRAQMVEAQRLEKEARKFHESARIALDRKQKGFDSIAPIILEELPLLPASSSAVGRILTYCEWKERGHQVKRGEKAIGRNSKGEATFDHHQVGRKPVDC